MLMVAGCGDDDPATPPAPVVEDPILVLFVPGFMSEMQAATSLYLEDYLCDTLKAKARELNFTIPVVGDVLIGDGIAARIQCPNVIPDGSLLTFTDQLAYFKGQGITCHIMTDEAGFNSEMGVAHNAAAIAEYLDGVTGHRVVIVSHSKGGLDTLHALLTNTGLWNEPVIGWVALQSPFHGSPLADLMPPALSNLVLGALGGNGQALTDISVGTREDYMRDQADAIARLTDSISVQSCYSSYSASGTMEGIVRTIADNVFTGSLVTDIVQMTKDKFALYPLNPARALSEATQEAAALVNQRIRSIVNQSLGQIGLMDTTNRGMLATGQPNDGLVPALSARLDGAAMVELAPEADHAAPVMITAPFKQFWTTPLRNNVTWDLVESGTGALE